MCTACASLNPDRAEAFAGRMLRLLNDGALSLMISVGHRTGLFDAMAGQPPTSSRELAVRAGAQERYVREWLGAMVTGGIVECQPEEGTYSLPAEHSAFLTRAASPNNMAVTAQFMPLLGGVEDEIVECFRRGGGVPYSRYHRFHQIMLEESDQSVVAGLEEHVLPLVPGLKERLQEGIEVMDVGCGSGRALNWMARRFPKSRFRGYDFSEEAISSAREEARRHGTTNVEFAVQDAGQILEESRYDLICAFDAIHDQIDPAGVLDALQRALKPNGHFLMQDIRGESAHHENIDNPIAPLCYTISCMHCMTVSLASGGAGLGAMWGRQMAERMLAEAGFGHVEVKTLEHDILNYWYVVTH